LPADRRLSSDRRRGDRGEHPDAATVPIAAQAAARCQLVITEPFSAKVPNGQAAAKMEERRVRTDGDTVGVQVAQLRQDLAGKRAATCCSTILRIACGTFFGVYEVVVGWCPTVAETSQTLVAPSCAHVRPVRRLGAHGVCGRACSCWKTPVSAQAASASVIRFGRQRANHLLKRRGAIRAVAGREPLNDVNVLSCAV